jgi:hypothetical protein
MNASEKIRCVTYIHGYSFVISVILLWGIFLIVHVRKSIWEVSLIVHMRISI